jgi:hypothetical protein
MGSKKRGGRAPAVLTLRVSLLPAFALPLDGAVAGGTGGLTIEDVVGRPLRGAGRDHQRAAVALQHPRPVLDAGGRVLDRGRLDPGLGAEVSWT